MKQRGPWKVKGSRIAYRNRWMSVREDAVTHPDGTPGTFSVVSFRGGCSVIPMDASGNIYLIKEYYYAIEKNSLGAVNGGREKGESSLAAAKRELREETGFVAKRWTDLGAVEHFSMNVDAENHMYLAEGLSSGPSSPDDFEHLQMVAMPFARALRFVMNGKITHSATCVALLKIALLRGNTL